MITEDHVTIFGASELRTKTKQLLATLNKNQTVLLTNRGEVVGVFVNYQDYKSQKKMIEEYEDIVLGNLAKKREAKKNKKISMENMIELVNEN